MSGQVTKVVEKIVSPILNAEGYELVDIEYTKEGANWFLRIFIDCEQKPVDLNDCSHFSELISEQLDKSDPIQTAYMLEVSSPGAERPLKSEQDLQKAVGSHVHLTLYAPIEGSKEFQGELIEVTSQHLEIKLAKSTIAIPRDKVAKARLAIVF